jgi:hypothetical protein
LQSPYEQGAINPRVILSLAEQYNRPLRASSALEKPLSESHFNVSSSIFRDPLPIDEKPNSMRMTGFPTRFANALILFSNGAGPPFDHVPS